MIRENNAKQGHLAKGAVQLNEAFTTSSTLKPQASLPHVRWRTMTKGFADHSLGTCSGLFVLNCQTSKETKSELIYINLALEEEKLTKGDHDKGYTLQLARRHTGLSR